MAWSPDLEHRSHLFAPGSNERIVNRAVASTADVVVVDLEDGIDQTRRGEAHRILERLAPDAALRPTHVRVATRPGGYELDDVAIALRIGVEAIRLPKADDPSAVAEVAALCQSSGARPAIHVTIETALGLASLEKLVAASDLVTRVVFGERDFLADMGVDEPGVLTDTTRASIAMRSRALGIGTPLDGAFVDLDDSEGLQMSCQRARSLGFGGKSAIHPSQLATIDEAFSPSDADVERARKVVEAFDHARSHGEASVVVDGRFIDEALVRRARSILESKEV